MTAFSELVIFLSLALLAGVVAIFVFAASLLRNAIPQALEKQRKIAAEHNEEFENNIADMHIALDAARGTGGFRDLEKKLHDYDKSRKYFEKASKRIAGRYQLLKMRGGVVYPAVVLLLALALARSVELVTAQAWQGILFALSLLAVSWVCYRIYEILSVVQSVAMTPEDVGDKTREAFETALERHEEKRRPSLELEFIDPKPPIKMKPDSEQKIWFDVVLKKGDIARAAQVNFVAPISFEFPGHTPSRRPTNAPLFPDTWETSINMGDIKRGLAYKRSVSIKTPPNEGIYRLAHMLLCDGYASRIIEFDIEVEA